MMAPNKRIYTIQPARSFLEILAREILAGFPVSESDRPDLSQWTILVPTRAAARSLADIFTRMSEARALVLPLIKPIGDIEEDALAQDEDSIDLPDAISPHGLLFVLLGLVKDWAEENPQIGLAREIEGSHAQALALSLSLLKVVGQIDVDEADLATLPLAYEQDLTEHREAILSLLSLLHVRLPEELTRRGVLTATSRRGKLIRLEAECYENGSREGPVIAAGSTGTIAATRKLLSAIAGHRHGAVVLPGLALGMDYETWKAIAPDHPQYSMKLFLDEVGVNPSDVQTLGFRDASRSFLTTELSRPTATAEQWHRILPAALPALTKACKGLSLIEAPDRHAEARAIALIMKRAHYESRSAMLVTPDRDLGKRVGLELQRWGLTPRDTAGVPLAEFGAGLLIDRCLHCVLHDFAPGPLLDVLSFPSVTLGFDKDKLDIIRQHFEIAVLRSPFPLPGLAGFARTLQRVRANAAIGIFEHGMVAKLKEEEWLGIEGLVIALENAFAEVLHTQPSDFGHFLAAIQRLVVALAPSVAWDDPENIALMQLFADLGQNRQNFPPSSFHDAALTLCHLLTTIAVRDGDQSGKESSLTISGLLEARLMPSDVVILGGLNDTIWPAEPDAGPWLNRSMRDVLKLTQPERQIGLSGHDFVQGLSMGEVYVTYAKRIGSAPSAPSRWILRLKTVFEGGGLKPGHCHDDSWINLARRIVTSAAFKPLAHPRPCPPVSSRPRRFTASEIEKLISDPYAIYAKKILQLECFPAIGTTDYPRLRGILFHRALGLWAERLKRVPSEPHLWALHGAGVLAFATYRDEPRVMGFWWPRFLRAAQWLISEGSLYMNVKDTHVEIKGTLTFAVGGINHSLVTRADRIDVLRDGSVRIIDYKTGSLPSNSDVINGLAPQLPLEAAMVIRRAFPAVKETTIADLVYIRFAGGNDEGDIAKINPKTLATVEALATRDFEGLLTLLAAYQKPDQPYLPRASHFKDNKSSEFDHLSRYAEWLLDRVR